MEINLRRIQSRLTWHFWVIKHVCPICITHAWSTSEGGYLHLTAIIPIKTVCKQFINGSVPFDYSLNSGFDTGMTADRAEMLGRRAHLFRKCLQIHELEGNFVYFQWNPGSSIQKEACSQGIKGSTVLLYPRAPSLRCVPRAPGVRYSSLQAGLFSSTEPNE